MDITHYQELAPVLDALLVRAASTMHSTQTHRTVIRDIIVVLVLLHALLVIQVCHIKSCSLFITPTVMKS